MFYVYVLCMFCQSPEVTLSGWQGYKPSTKQTNNSVQPEVEALNCQCIFPYFGRLAITQLCEINCRQIKPNRTKLGCKEERARVFSCTGKRVELTMSVRYENYAPSENAISNRNTNRTPHDVEYDPLCVITVKCQGRHYNTITVTQQRLCLYSRVDVLTRSLTYGCL